ncbi:MAG: DUF4870 domain-containing protein [Candidatus Latescibacteria bacterium]|nr:DUF4870 domain-containing protein [Candidatus Latescibacterota bacterium]
MTTTSDNPEQARQWALFLHLSLLAGLLAPLAGFIIPILIWQLKKAEFPELDIHGRIVANWMISEIIYALVFGVLCIILIGIPFAIALGIVGLIFPIMGGLKANKGEIWPYPLSLKVFPVDVEQTP